MYGQVSTQRVGLSSSRSSSSSHLNGRQQGLRLVGGGGPPHRAHSGRARHDSRREVAADALPRRRRGGSPEAVRRRGRTGVVRRVVRRRGRRLRLRRGNFLRQLLRRLLHGQSLGSQHLRLRCHCRTLQCNSHPSTNVEPLARLHLSCCFPVCLDLSTGWWYRLRAPRRYSFAFGWRDPQCSPAVATQRGVRPLLPGRMVQHGGHCLLMDHCCNMCLRWCPADSRTGSHSERCSRQGSPSLAQGRAH